MKLDTVVYWYLKEGEVLGAGLLWLFPQDGHWDVGNATKRLTENKVARIF